MNLQSNAVAAKLEKLRRNGAEDDNFVTSKTKQGAEAEAFICRFPDARKANRAETV